MKQYTFLLKMCLVKDCNSKSIYGYETPEYCLKHKKDDMKNLTDKRKCLSCNKQPSYGWKGGKPEYCTHHKLEGMINLKSKRCEYDNCNKNGILVMKEKVDKAHCFVEITKKKIWLI
jgi:hypothetical protein